MSLTYDLIGTVHKYVTVSESGGLVVTSRTLIREVPGSIPGGATYHDEGSVVVLHHQANAGVDPI